MKALLQLDQWPVDLAAAAWIDSSGRSEHHGPTDTTLPLASVTKPLFAYAVLVAIEEGSLALHQPAGPDGSTLRHLLAHASGLGDDSRSSLSGVERRRIYSNGAYDLLGEMLAAATGMATATYLHEAVIQPLGLTSTILSGSPAHAAHSSVDDLLLILAEWLHPTLIAASTMADAISPQFPHLSGVLPGFGSQDPNPWGLGFELKGTKSPHWTGQTNNPATFGHFGRSGTFIWVDPVAQVGCVALTTREFGPWAAEAWPLLSDAVLVEASEAGSRHI